MLVLLMMAEEAAEEEEEAGWSKKNKKTTWQCGEKRLKPDSSHHNPRWWSGKELKNGEPCRFGNLVDGLSHLNSHYLQCFIVINMFPTGV